MRIKPSPDKKSIIINYPLGEACGNSFYNLTVNLTYGSECNKFACFNFTKLFDQLNPDKTNCNLSIDIQTNQTCIIHNYYIGYQFFMEWKFILGPILILLGLYFLILGGKFIFLTEILAGGLAFSLALFSIIFNFFLTAKHEYFTPTQLKVFIIILVGFICGVAISLLFRFNKEKLNVSILTCGTGYLIGILTFNLILRNLNDNVDTNFWTTIIVCSIGGSLFPLYYESYKKIVFVTSTIIGGYLCMRGITLLIGEESGFPSENIIFDLLSRGEFLAVNKYRTWQAYCYLALWIIMTLLALLFPKMCSTNCGQNNSKISKILSKSELY